MSERDEVGEPTTIEPTTPAAIDAWIGSHVMGADDFAAVAAATEAHRVEHGCDAYAGSDGPLLRVLAAVARPRHVLEVGTALGYSALQLAAGAGPGAIVDTVEADPVHADLARAQRDSRGFADRIRVHVGRDLEVLEELPSGYDLVFYDAGVPTPAHLAAFDRLLAPRGTLVTSNLFLGLHVPDHPHLPEGARYREALFGAGWTTAFVGTKALSVRSSSSG